MKMTNQIHKSISKSRGAASPTGGQRRGTCPPALTGGESLKTAAKVDWLTTTWLPEPDEHIRATIHSHLLDWIPAKVVGIDAPGMLGYEKAVKFYILLDDGAEHHVARLDYGGMHHKMRARLDLSGSACARITQWHLIQTWIAAQFDYKITRVDLAADFLEGEYTVEDAKEWYLAGEFNAGGRMPRHSTPGDWFSPHYGRTLEVGRRENGKMLRCYEKGRQLGNPSSKWTRFEVELRNIDRDIPLDVLTNTDEYFVGAYKCLQKILTAAAEKIKTHQAEGEISLERLTECAKTSYGQLFNVLRATMSAGDVLDHLSRSGVPKRLEKASLSGFLTKAPPAIGNHHENAGRRN
jgi:phage replication initiation protein